MRNETLRVEGEHQEPLIAVLYNCRFNQVVSVDPHKCCVWEPETGKLTFKFDMVRSLPLIPLPFCALSVSLLTSYCVVNSRAKLLPPCLMAASAAWCAAALMAGCWCGTTSAAKF
jgi:hypothetical protein